jgi:hypothetical protein
LEGTENIKPKNDPRTNNVEPVPIIVILIVNKISLPLKALTEKQDIKSISPIKNETLDKVVYKVTIF